MCSIFILLGPSVLVLARVGGWGRRWLGSGWRIHALGLTVLAGLAIVISAWRTEPSSTLTWAALEAHATAAVTWTFAVETLALYLLLWLLFKSNANKDKLVILGTANHAGKDYADFTAGCSIELANQLGALSALYKTIDEANNPRQGETAAPRVRVDNPGDLLADVVGESSKVSFGLLAVPLRPLVAAFERMRPRRRLSVNLHRNGDRLMLLADLEGRDGSWSVERELAAGPAEAAIAQTLRELKDELVYSVFAEVVRVGSADWQAVKYFSDGLRAYRRALRTDVRKQLNLRPAEDSFLTARSFDRCFARCTYNLGVVYLEMSKYLEDNSLDGVDLKIDSAKAAFRRAIRENPGHADAAYALASIYTEKTPDLATALEFADRAIACNPRDPRPWNLKGYVWRRLQNPMDSPRAWESSLEFRRRSAALAWWDLCRDAWCIETPEASKSKRQAVATSLRGLAVALCHLHRRRIGERILRMAIRVLPDSDLYFDLAQVLESQSKIEAEALYRAAISRSNSDIETARYHSCLTNIYVSAPLLEGNFQRFSQSVDNALRLPSNLDAMIKDNIVCAITAFVRDDCLLRRNVDPNEYRKKIAQLRAVKIFLDLCRPQPMVVGTVPMAEIEFTKFGKLGSSFGKIVEANSLMNKNCYAQAVPLFQDAEAFIKENFPFEIDFLSIVEERIAEALRLQDRSLDAIPLAAQAIASDPFSPSAIRQEGIVHSMISDFTYGEKMLRRAFALSPSNPRTLEYIALNLLSRGAPLSSRTERTSAFRDAIATYSDALQLTIDINERGKFHHWLGRFHSELCAYDRADENYAIAASLKRFQIESYFYRSLCKIDQQLFDAAEHYLRQSLDALYAARQSSPESAAGSKCKPGFDWWLTPKSDLFTNTSDTPLYFLIITTLLLALVFAERGDLDRAKRRLRFVERVRRRFDTGSYVRRGFEERLAIYEKRKEIEARHKAYLGWTLHLEGKGRAGLDHLMDSLKLVDDCETHFFVARARFDRHEFDLASSSCDRARTTDIRGAFADRIARLEARIAKAAH